MNEGAEILGYALDRLNPLRPREKGYRIGVTFTPEEFELFCLDLKERIDGVHHVEYVPEYRKSDHENGCKCVCGEDI